MEVMKIPLSLVYPSPMNPRKTFDEGELQELADNIEKQGLLQPITVRPITDKFKFANDAKIGLPISEETLYEIICGERRFRAFSKLSEKWREMDCVAPKGATYNRFIKIPAIVRAMSDDEAFDAMITENLQRKDVDPIEEAFAFGQLVQKGKTAEEVAARFGKSIRFVQDRVKLNNLIPELMLAVRDDKMPIVAAMIIAKLDDEDQHKYLKQYGNSYYGFSKSTAETFVNNLFMTLDKSLWYQSGDQSDEDFDGGCGRKCSECINNTTNHGCLFWEMKSQDAGRCTNRAKFTDKTLAFILREVDRRREDLVKKNQPLTFGKTVLGIMESSYISETDKTLKQKLTEALANRDIEVVNPTDVFSHRVSYDSEDDRTIKMLNDGEAYRCLVVFDYNSAALKEYCYYVKKDDNSVNSDENGVPLAVNKILKDLRYEEDLLKSSFSVAGAEALKACSPSAETLSEDERVLLLTCMLNNNYSLCDRVGITCTSDKTSPDNLKKWVSSHRDKWVAVQLAWMFQQIAGAHANLRAAEPILETLGEKHCSEQYQKAIGTVRTKFDKKRAKAEKQLKELGYGLDGEPLAKEECTNKIPNGKSARQQLKGMKAKHPDAIILFAVNNFYECFDEDADKVAETLNLTVTATKDGKLAGFPKHALDTYLPKLIRAGLRVAISEQLQDPKKSK